MKDDLSRVLDAVSRSPEFLDLLHALKTEVAKKQVEEPLDIDRLRSYQVALLHEPQCASLRDRTKTQGAIHPCDCGVARRHRTQRADMIEAHLDCAGTLSHRNALELRDHWCAAEAELTDALEQIERLSARINNAVKRAEDVALERERGDL